MNKQDSKYRIIVDNLSSKRHLHLMPLLLSCILLFGFSESVFGQDLLSDPIAFGTNEGAINAQVSKFAEDRDGFIWIGTRKGLSRFDGSSFEHFQHNPADSTSIASDHIFTLCPNKITGEIWVSHGKGLSIFLPKQNIFKNFLLKKNLYYKGPELIVSSIFIDDQGVVWLGFKDEGLYKYKRAEDRFEKIFIGTEKKGKSSRFSVRNIQQDIFDKEKLWMNTNDGLISFHKKDKTVSAFWLPETERKSFTTRSMSSIIKSSDWATSFCQMQNGDIYVCFQSNGVFHLNRKNGDYTRIKDYERTKIPIVDDRRGDYLYPNSDHDFWISSDNSTSLYDVASGCIVYTKRTKIKSVSKSRIGLIDSQNRIWTRRGQNGFYIYNPEGLKNYDFEEIEYKRRSYKRSLGIIERKSKDEIIAVFGLKDGLHIINQASGKSKVITLSEESRKNNKHTTSSADMTLLQDETILLYRRRKLFLYRDGIDTLIRIQLSKAPTIWKILQDKAGTVWVAHNKGLSQLDMKTYTLIDISKNLKEAHKNWFRRTVIDMTEDKFGNIHMLTPDGICVFLKKENRFFYHEIEIEPIKSKPDDIKINPGCIKSDKKGNIFILLYERYLGYVDLDKLKSKPMKFIDIKQDEVKTFVPFGDSLILIRNNGVQFFNTISKEFESKFSFGKTFDPPIKRASLLGNDQVAVLRKEGYFHFDPLKLKSPKNAQEVYLKNLKVLGIEEKIPATINEKQRLELEANENFFSLKFAVKGFDFADKTTFRYQLSGVDREWQVGTPDEFIRYTEVPGGDYPFIVESIGVGDVVLGTTTIATIHIAIPWWKSLWFRILFICSVLTLAAFLYKRKIDRTRKEERQAAEVKKLVAEAEMAALRAQMNPHFIFNSLNSIDYYIIKKDQETASDYLNRFSRLIRLVLKNSQQERVSLKEDLEALQLYIQLERLRFKNAFEYNISISEDLHQDQLKIPPMLIQPYVENAIWHGLMQQKNKAGKLLLKLYIENNFLICHIEDNGIGREAALIRKSKSGSKQKSFGMKITGDRLALLNTNTDAASTATVAVIDLKNEDGSAAGTRVELMIPVG